MRHWCFYLPITSVICKSSFAAIKIACQKMTSCTSSESDRLTLRFADRHHGKANRCNWRGNSCQLTDRRRRALVCPDFSWTTFSMRFTDVEPKFASSIRGTNRRPPTWLSAMRRRVEGWGLAWSFQGRACSMQRPRSQRLMPVTRRCCASRARFRRRTLTAVWVFSTRFQIKRGCSFGLKVAGPYHITCVRTRRCP
jgi:hypothetical protein